MGNWRTVHLVGSCDPGEVQALREHLTVDLNNPDHDTNRFGPLSIVKPEPLCGLGDWPAQVIDVSGNLAERDYTVQDVCAAVTELVAVAPSLRLTVHCGGDYEDTGCVATLHVENAVATEGPPEVETVTGVTEETMQARLVQALAGPRL